MTQDYYKADNIRTIRKDLTKLRKQRSALTERLSIHGFTDRRAKEYCNHGLLRRLAMLSRNVENVFGFLPPDLVGLPSDDAVEDATANLHSFYINLFGACDNIAWVLVFDKKIKSDTGNDIPRTKVGIRKKNKGVRAGLSKKMVSRLDKLEVWFDHVEEFRDSLAHRIPLYIPPFTIRPEDAEDYQRLGSEARQALMAHDFDENKQLRVQRDELKFFLPVYKHSFSEGSPTMAIHPQMISDFGAILKLSEAMAEEIE